MATSFSQHSSPDDNVALSDRSSMVLVVTVVTLCIATLFTVGRLISRAGIVKHMELDDYLIVVGWILSFGVCFVIAFATGKGFGKLDVNIKEEWMLSLKKCEYAFSVLYNPALVATKSSLLVFYLRLSRATNKLFRVISYLTLALVNVGGLVLTLLNVFQCQPISKTFNSRGDTAKCIPIITLYLASAPITVVTDVIILVLPIPLLTGMQMPRRQKNILVFTFALGIFVMIVDVIRIYFLQEAMRNVLSLNSSGSAYLAIGLGDQKDFAYLVSYSLMWSVVEINVGIVCACIPTLKPVVRRVFPALIGHIRRHSTQDDHHPASVAANHGNASGSMPSSTPKSRGGIPLTNGGEASPQIPPLEGTPPRRRETETENDEIDEIEFITVPASAAITQRKRQMSTASSSETIYFGFINMQRPISLVDLSVKDSWRYCTAVTILFFLWGFSYGLLNRLNAQIVTISNSSAPQGIGLLSAYFGGYLFGPLSLGWYVLTKGGFKATFIAGLCVYGIGTLMFWPSAVLVSFPGFIVATFFVGFGLSVLETAANPFLALAGPAQYGEMRLLLAQGVQAVGSVVSELLAERVFFEQVKAEPTLISVQWTYLAISYLGVIIALFFYYMPLPEATDQELERAARSPSLPMNRAIIERKETTHIGSFKVVSITLALAVSAQFFYVAAQETVNLWFAAYLGSLTHHRNTDPPPRPSISLTIPSTSLVSHSVFAASRFLSGALCLVIRPRILLLASLLGGSALSIAISALPASIATTRPNTIASLVIGMYFFEGPVFPLIFAIALRGLGRASKRGAAMVAAGTGGGAVGPWILVAAQRGVGVIVRGGFWVVTMLLGMGCVFPAYLGVARRAREVVDGDGHDGGGQGGRKWRISSSRVGDWWFVGRVRDGVRSK